MASRRTLVATRSMAAQQGFDDKEVLARVGRTIRALRSLRGFSQTELAKKAASSQNHISNVESGKRDPGLVLLIRIAQCLSVPLDMLIVPALEPAQVNRAVDNERARFGTDLRDLLITVLEDAAHRPT